MSRDPRLTWRALTQPDLSAASQAVARANAAFHAGLDGARRALEHYEEGERRRSSGEVAAELMGLDSPEAMAEWAANGGLNGRDVDPAILTAMLGLRGDLANVENTQARTAATQAASALAGQRFELEQQDRAAEAASNDTYNEIMAAIMSDTAPAAPSAPAAPAPGPTAAVPPTFRLGVPTEQPTGIPLTFGTL